MRSFTLCAYVCALFVLGAGLIPKVTDRRRKPLIELADIGEGCDRSAQHGYGIVDGYLEHCEKYNIAKESDNATVKEEYEAFRCKHLRLKGKVGADKICKCSPSWYGVACENTNLCDKPNNKTYSAWFNGKCAKNACFNGGKLAVGPSEVECTCVPPWDGRHCNQLACFRLGDPHDPSDRFQNNGTSCNCGKQFSGPPECSTIIDCMHNGTLIDGHCECPEMYYGSVCHRKKICKKDKDTGETICSSSAATSIFMAVITLALSRW